MLLIRGRAARPALAAAAVVTALTAVPANAETETAPAATKPVPCTEMLVTDPAGDAVVGPVLGAGPVVSEAPANMDITGIFVNTKTDATGKLVTTANIRIADLNKDIPDEIPT